MLTLEEMKRLKQTCGYSNQWIADKTGIPLATVMKIFGGTTKTPRHETLLALEKAERFEKDPKYADYATMMVKTHLSLSHDPNLKGVPKNWRLPIRDILEYGGARFLCPMAGAISMMPGTGSNPAYRRIDVDTQTGAVSGLF